MEFGRLPVQDGQDDQDNDDDGSQHGSDLDEDSNHQPNNWARLYHRDLVSI